MPALILFKRRWQVGGDDLVFPAVGSASVRLIFLASAIAVFVIQHPNIQHCKQGDLLAGFLIGLVILLSITVALETAIGVVSGRGTITDTYPRRYLAALLYIRALVFVAEIASSLVGAVWVFRDWELRSDHTCDVSLVRLVQAALIFCWFLLIAIAICVLVLFGGKHRHGDEQFDDFDQWEKRCRRCCFCLKKDENSQIAYAEAAAVFSSLFHGVDVVLSDIVAGLILVQVEQQRQIRDQIPMTASCKDPGPDVALPTEPVERRLETMWYYFRYSMASNGWPVLFAADLKCWLCKLCCAGRCCACIRPSERIIGDNCCQCNTTAIRSLAGADEEDLLYVSFKNKIFQSPFFVALDHTHKSVVIAIRGTLSFKDMLTDVSADAERLDIEGHEIYAHRGIANNSKYILNKLKELNLLEDAFQRHPDYKLVISGHSLGAGVAAILSILLREQYPEIKAYAFAPPGGLINAEGVLYSQSFVTAVVLGEDIVPRMSMCTIEQLRDSLIEVIKRCPVPKYRVILRGLWYTCKGLPENLPLSYNDLDHEDGLCCNPREPLLPASPRGAEQRLLATPTEEGHGSREGNGGIHSAESIEVDVGADEPGASSNGRHSSVTGGKEFMALYPPGQMIWITRREMHSGGCCGSKDEYRARWVTHRQFDHIGVLPGMIKDHLPIDIKDAFAWLVDQVKNGHVVHPDVS
ncbi:sn1-specific diacylglycerol lipase beta [Strongylocentrotus purpuratus]|uniref:sn-1-specific diacylglycerol lipase n=1 Tax=Strongylocentrotus purpuratus TaxID=7668 RepID=A0A7M7NMD6_STRPU|nr:sn1-specific diacylglycerol lipase beta [Strongylocentrotus purpuratus]XP_030838438.1 sn1-specific diacylglycerol lipase beta [Strongylocentrotus purpuratus]